MRIHRVYCKSVSGPNTKFALDNIQSHHLIKALRLKEGRVTSVSWKEFLKLIKIMNHIEP